MLFFILSNIDIEYWIVICYRLLTYANAFSLRIEKPLIFIRNIMTRSRGQALH